MATNGWIGEQTVHSWGKYNSRLTTNVYINGIRRYSDHIDVSGVIYLFCKSSGARTVWYDWAITAWCGGRNLGLIKSRTYNNNILGKSWSKNFSIRINCSNSATSATFQVGFSDSNMGGKDKYWTLYFDRYATSPSGISSVAGYTQYSTISTSCSGINWGQGYSSRKLTCVASYTYNGKTENFTLGTWTDGATSKSVTKTDFNFPADLNVTVKWTASTNIGSTSSTAQIKVKQTFPAPNLSNTTFTAESTAPYCIRVNVSGVDFGDNYSAQKLELYGTYELDGIIYDNKLGEISNQTSWTLEYDASQEAEPWTKIPDDSSILLRLVADNGNRTSDKTIIINCQSSYEAYVIEHIPEEEKEKSDTYTGKNIQIQNAPKDAPLADFKLKGNTSQQTYSGKNLLKYPYKDTTVTRNNVTFTVNSDGSIATSGTARAEALFWLTNDTWAYNTNNIVVPAGTYTINKTGKTYIALYVTAYGETQGQIGTYNATTSDTTFTVPEKSSLTVRLRVVSGANTGGFAYSPQLESGSSATSFEPYVGGTASPSPDYPQAVQTVTGENVVKINGKNLLEITHTSSETKNGITVNWDGSSFILNGTATANTDLYGHGQSWGDTSKFYPLLAGTYTMSVRKADMSLGADFAVKMYNNSGTSKRIFDFNASGGAATDTLDTDSGYTNFYISITSGKTFNNERFYVQLEKSSQATEYQPYQGQSYEVNLGKNLFDKDNANIMTGTADAGGYFVPGGRNKTLYIPCQPNTTYTIQKRNDGNYNRFIVATSDTNPNTGGNVPIYGRIENYNAASITITTNGSASFLLVTYYRDQETVLTEQQILDSIQIEVGAQKTDYAAYFTPIELCKIGDYQDYIYKNGGKWYVHKEVDRKNLNGSEEWNLAERSGSNNGVFYIDYNKIGTVGAKNNGAFSNYARFISGYSYLVGQFDTHYSQWRFYALNNTITLNEWKTNLGATPLVLYYLPATPTDTEITNAALIEQLDSLFNTAKIYAGINNIFTITPNEQGTLEIQYYTKWQNTSPAILSANGRNGTGNFKQIRRIGTK